LQQGFSEDLEVPLGTSILMRNGSEIDYENYIQYFPETSLGNQKFAIGFIGNFSNNIHDSESYSLSFILGMDQDEINNVLNDKLEIWDHDRPNIHFGMLVDGHVLGYKYKMIKGTAFVDLVKVDTVNRVVNIRWRASFIREDTNGWLLDFPYRADMLGIIHDRY